MIAGIGREWIRLYFLAFTFAFTILGCGSGGGDSTSNLVAPSCTDVTPARQFDTSHLRSMAKEEGSARIIVQLKINSGSSRSLAREGTTCAQDTSDPSQPETGNQNEPVVITPSQASTIEEAQTAVIESLADNNVTEVKVYETIPFVAMVVDSAALTALENNPLVESIEEDVVIDAFLAESGPLIGATTAHSAGNTGSGQAVAILDTGVEYDHPFLTGRVVDGACFATNCTYGATGSTSAPDGHGHGTHVAGIAAGAAGVNGALVGVAPSASIIAVKVLSDSGSGWYSDILAGLDYIYSIRGSYNIASINMSLGGGSSTSECDSSYPAMTTTINNLASAGIATVIASGNNGYTDRISFPGCISTAVSVGSTCDSAGGSYCSAVDAVATYSNSASFLDILAPGSYIDSSTKGSGWGYGWSGTSMATPQVAGAWAVIKASGAASSVSGVLSLLQSTGKSVTDSRNGITKKRIQVDTAIGAGAVLGATMVTPADGATFNGNSQAFTWTDVSATQYALYIGTTPGASDLFNINAGTNLTTTVTGLPIDASTVYVQLRSQISGTWYTNDYTYTAAPNIAVLSGPTDGSTFTSSSQTFTWVDVGADAYAIWVGSAQGNFDYRNGYAVSGATVIGLPTLGAQLYVRLWSVIGGTWYYTDSQFTAYTAGAPTSATLSTPADGSTFTSSSQTFTWADVGADAYAIWVGSAQGNFDYFNGYVTSGVNIIDLPTLGASLYVRLWSVIGGKWYYNDYSFTAFTAAGGGSNPLTTPAVLSGPADGSTFTSSSQTFTWVDVGADAYAIWVGSAQGNFDYRNGYAVSGVTVIGLPTLGAPLYVRLWSVFSGTWYYNDYSFTAYTAPPPTSAVLSGPANGSTFISSSQTFTWVDVGADAYAIWVGSAQGNFDYFNGYATSGVTIINLPTLGAPLYVRLWSVFNGVWYYNDYQFTAFTQ